MQAAALNSRANSGIATGRRQPSPEPLGLWGGIIIHLSFAIGHLSFKKDAKFSRCFIPGGNPEFAHAHNLSWRFNFEA
jgi:hypothetical protein